jgi:hypothetical protein
MIKVVLFIVLVLPGQKPVMHQEVTAGLEECIGKLADVVMRPPEAITLGGIMQVSCVVEYPPGQKT